METLRLEDLLPFLNGRSEWTLRCRNGKYSLRFGRKKFKFKGVTAVAVSRGRRGGALKIADKKRITPSAAGDDYMRAKWLREIGAAGLRNSFLERFLGENSESNVCRTVSTQEHVHATFHFRRMSNPLQ